MGDKTISQVIKPTWQQKAGGFLYQAELNTNNIKESASAAKVGVIKPTWQQQAGGLLYEAQKQRARAAKGCLLIFLL